MKRNGFTLIEVIGTMVILSIILLISFPMIKDAFNATKGELSEEQIASLENVARIWATKNSNELSEETPRYLTIEELKRSGLVENKEILKMNSDEELQGCIKIYFEGNKYNYKYENSENCVYNNEIKLPNQYQKVEYIRSTGSQYIDTGVKIGVLTSPAVEITMRNSGTYKNAEVYALTGIYESAPNIFQLGLVLTSTTTCRASMNVGSGAVGVTDLDSSVFHTLYVKDGLQKVNDVEVGNTKFAYDEQNYNFYLFGRWQGTAGKQLFGMQISECKIFDNGILIRNFVPCYRKSDNVIGMYDLVNNEFYTNNGTGVFTKGNDI